MEEPEIDLRRILSTMGRQWRLILASIVVAATVASITVFALTPLYTASTLILIDPSKKNLLEPDAQAMSSSAADSARIDSEVELIDLDSILLKVIGSMDLISNEEFRPTLGMRARVMSLLKIGEISLPTGQEALGQTLGKLKKAVSVQRKNLTYLITLDVRSQSPQLAADIANAIANAYIEDQVQSKVASVLASKTVLTTRIEEARTALAASETSFDQFIQDNLDHIAQTSSRADLRRLQQQFEQLRANRQQLTSTADIVSTRLAEGDWKTVVASLQDDALTELEQQRTALVGEMANSQDGSPIAVNLREQLSQIEDKMRQTAQTQVSGLQASLQQTQQQETDLRQQLRQIVLQGDLPADMLTQMYEVQQNAQLARDQYQNLLARSQDLDAQANLQIADSRVVSPALAPSVASFPNNPLIFAMLLVVGLGTGVALAFLYEHFLGGFVSEEQLESVLRVKVAGGVPHAKMPSESDSLANMLLISPLSSFSESLRGVRALIDQSFRNTHHDDKKARIIMVTSTAPHEGKSTLSLALGRSYALAGQKTLLIDADLRKPSIHRHLGLTTTVGLMEFLKNSNNNYDGLGEMLETDETGLSLILGAQRSDVPTDQLINAPIFKHLIDAASKSFDIVIMDTPPVGPVVDALYISRFANIVLFVNKWASTSQTAAKQAVESLKNAVDADTPVLAVLNDMPNSRSSYYRRYGGYTQD